MCEATHGELMPLIFWGAGGHARVVADIIALRCEYRVVGFIDNVNPDRQGEDFCGAKVLGGCSELLDCRRRGIEYIVLAFGDCRARYECAAYALSLGFSLVSAIHPGATIAGDVKVGDGTVVVAGAVINPNTHIGKNVLVNTLASIDHDCVLGDAVHVAPGAHVAAHVRIGCCSWIGLGVIVKEGVTIGSDVLIGAGALVLSDVPNGVVAYGSPARVIRENK